MNGTQGRITLLSALLGLFFGSASFIALLVAGAGTELAFPVALMTFASVMLAAHIFFSVQDAAENRRYARYERSLGEPVRARFIANIFEGENGMGGMVYVLSGRLLLSSVGRRGLWETTVRPGEIHHAEQIDPISLKIQCLDGRVYRIMAAPMDELLDALSAMDISVVRLPMM